MGLMGGLSFLAFYAGCQGVAQSNTTPEKPDLRSFSTKELLECL
jgi:hypothetical protein